MIHPPLQFVLSVLSRLDLLGEFVAFLAKVFLRAFYVGACGNELLGRIDGFFTTGSDP
jgi:hypothetical protein